MIRNVWMSLFSLFVMVSMATAQNTKTPSTGTASLVDATKSAVEQFGVGIINSYFTQDCNYLYSRLHTTIISMENGQVFQKNSTLQTQLCAESPLRTDMTVTMDMYNQNHKRSVMTAAEFRQVYGAIATQVQMQDGDYFFDGSQLQSKLSTSVFRASDMARFIVRKVNGEWKIIAM